MPGIGIICIFFTSQVRTVYTSMRPVCPSVHHTVDIRQTTAEQSFIGTAPEQNGVASAC